VQHDNRVRIRQPPGRPPRHECDLFVPPSSLHLDRLPASVHENVRIGNWGRRIHLVIKQTTDSFSTFSFLHLIDGGNIGSSYGFPSEGVPFNTGRALLQSIVWFFQLPLSGATTTEQFGRDTLVHFTTLLRGLAMLT
jgi:hypothetical protein